MTKKLTLLHCQRQLLLTWLVGLIPAMLLMTIGSLTGKFSGKEQEVWAWFVPMFLPSITLMIGAYSSVALKDTSDVISVDKFFFLISMGCSVFYILTLTGVIIYQPFANSSVLETFSRSSLFLSVIQGITTGCLGVFFVSQKQQSKEAVE